MSAESASCQLHPAGSSLYLDLLAVLNRAEPSLNHLQAESDQETDALRGMVVKLLVHLVDREVQDCEGSTSDFLGRVCSFSLPDSKALQLYHEEVSAEHSAASDLASLLRAVLSRHQEQCDRMSSVFPDIHARFVSTLQFCLALDMPGVTDAELQALESPAIVAFAFGTGRKIGPAMSLPALVGPSCETPGKMNCGLAATVAAVLEHRRMPVFAQWEIADALVHGSDGCPPELAAGFVDHTVGAYPLVEEYRGCMVHKSVPVWPQVCKKKGYTAQQMGNDPQLIGQYYLSTPGVVAQFKALWDEHPELKPKSVVVVGFPDHVGRCVSFVKIMAAIDTSIVCVPSRCYPSWDLYGCHAVTGYDLESSQPWTTSRTRFLARELRVRLKMGMSQPF